MKVLDINGTEVKKGMEVYFGHQLKLLKGKVNHIKRNGDLDISEQHFLIPGNKVSVKKIEMKIEPYVEEN